MDRRLLNDHCALAWEGERMGVESPEAGPHDISTGVAEGITVKCRAGFSFFLTPSALAYLPSSKVTPTF